MKIRRALLSVSDKTGIVKFAQFLESQKVDIISTGGTARLLSENGVSVRDISEITQFPEMLDGRVKTLHPAIHGGLLYVRGNDDHEKVIAEHEIGPIDLLLVNLYPFEETKARGAGEEEIIENIDIGGPSMLRSAAKNFAGVVVLSDPNDITSVQEEIDETGGVSLEKRRELAGKVFAKTASYDAAIADYFHTKRIPLRYGENPHQEAVLLSDSGVLHLSIPHSKQIQGKQMGYCNVLDADAALRIILEFSEKPSCAIIKHASPCGIATGNTLLEAYERALEADSVSAFGGVVAFNQAVDEETAQAMEKMFFEIILAPSVEEKAKNIFSSKENMRVLELGEMQNIPQNIKEFRSILGGTLEQNVDRADISEDDLVLQVGEDSEQKRKDAIFAWKIVTHVKSNAIVIVKDEQTVGIGGGQTSRVASSRIAVHHAQTKAQGAVAASDAFFPFADGVEFLAESGVKTIVQPGGSKRDAEVLEAAKKYGITMYFTGRRAFRH